ncbi:hypothetical protein D3C80_2058720 [compost metagenome]
MWFDLQLAKLLIDILDKCSGLLLVGNVIRTVFKLKYHQARDTLLITKRGKALL